MKSIQPSSQFADDDGSADAELTRLLAGYITGTTPLRDVVARLAETRVLVPVLAELGVAEQNPDGLTVDKEASSGVSPWLAPWAKVFRPSGAGDAASPCGVAPDATPRSLDRRRSSFGRSSLIRHSGFGMRHSRHVVLGSRKRGVR